MNPWIDNSSYVVIAVVWGALALLTACGVEVQGPEPPLDAIYDPVGLALHPSGDYLYVVNSNFNLDYREDRGGTVVVIDTDTLDIDPRGTVQIGTFGGDIKLNNPAEGGPNRAYIAVRGNRSITVLDLEEDGTRFNCPTTSNQRSSSCELGSTNDDPFGLAVTTLSISANDVPVEVDFVAVAHLLGGDIMSFTLKQGITDVVPISATITSGSNAIEINPRTGHFYAAGRFDGAVVAFRPIFDLEGDVAALVETGTVAIENASPFSGLDSRAIAFNNDGTEAYVSNRGPNSLLFVDVGPSDVNSNAGVRNRVTDLLPLPLDPAEVVVVPGAHGRELVYVAAFEDAVMLVVDPETRSIVETIEMPSEPYDVAVDTVKHQRLYVSLFLDDAIAIIDIDPSSPSYNQVTSVIR
ncbi:MAG: hypothetical protein AAFX99_03990 [Myxococcota bacterium]